MSAAVVAVGDVDELVGHLRVASCEHLAQAFHGQDDSIGSLHYGALHPPLQPALGGTSGRRTDSDPGSRKSATHGRPVAFLRRRAARWPSRAARSSRWHRRGSAGALCRCANGERHPRQCPIREQERAPDPFPHRHEPAEHSRPPPAAPAVVARSEATSAPLPERSPPNRLTAAFSSFPGSRRRCGGPRYRRGSASNRERSRTGNSGSPGATMTAPSPSGQIRDVLRVRCTPMPPTGGSNTSRPDAAAQRTSSGFAATAGPYTRRSGRHRG